MTSVPSGPVGIITFSAVGQQASILCLSYSLHCCVFVYLQMLTSTFLSVLLLSPFLSSASATNHATHVAHRRHHNSQSRRNVSNSTEAATLAATNCTRTYNVKEGEYCYAVAAMFNITLTQFYAYNPIVDSTCQNLWAGSDYCVSQAIC